MAMRLFIGQFAYDLAILAQCHNGFFQSGVYD
jgi:hypothetical protein